MLTKPAPTHFIQSLPHNGVFYHHAMYSGLKNIILGSELKESKPYRGISLTTDPGRYLSPLPVFAGICSVDGFVEFSADGVNACPALYHTHDEEVATEAKEKGFNVFEEGHTPPEYKYILNYATHPIMFIKENEWVVLAPRLYIANYKVYILPKFYKRLKNSLPRDKQDIVRSMAERRRVEA